MIVFTRSFCKVANRVEDWKSKIGRGKTIPANRCSMGEEGVPVKLYHPFLKIGRTSGDRVHPKVHPFRCRGSTDGHVLSSSLPPHPIHATPTGPRSSRPHANVQGLYLANNQLGPRPHQLGMRQVRVRIRPLFN
jgi:hypothetical protein